MGDFILLICGMLLVGLVYLMPTLVAVKRDHINMASILALNVLLGWTFLGWVAALVWSFSAQPNNQLR